MLPTVIGGVVLLAGARLWRRAPSRLLNLVLLSLVFGAAAAVQLPALGGASLPPSHLAFGLLAAKFATDRRWWPALVRAGEVEAPLVFFAAVTAIGAFVLPRIFAGALFVVGMRPLMVGGVIVPEALGPSSANITQLFYVVASALAAVAAYAVARGEELSRPVSRMMVALGVLQIVFGAVDQLAYYAHAGDVLEPLKNANYAQVAPQLFSSGVKRISGSFPEPSSYATFGFPVAVFLTEWWMRRPRAPWAGATALGVVLMLVLCTSSTGYVGLGLYGAVLALRAVRGPARGFRLRKALVLLALALAGAVVLLGLILALPAVATDSAEILRSMTVGKLSSSSADERLGWARQGWDAFGVSHGLGVGVGSFRSSSLVTALVGSTGVIGCGLLLLQLVRIAAPRGAAHPDDDGAAEAFTAASQYTALFSLVPLAAAGATPDPGLLFGLFGGFAMAAPVRVVRPELFRRAPAPPWSVPAAAPAPGRAPRPR